MGVLWIKLHFEKDYNMKSKNMVLIFGIVEYIINNIAVTSKNETMQHERTTVIRKV